MQIQEQSFIEQSQLDMLTQEQTQEQPIEEQNSLDYEQIASSAEFKALLAAKKKFTLVTTVFFLMFALLLPVLAFYTDVLTKPFYGAITWAWVYAFAQFAMTLIICRIYVRKAFVFDKMAEDILNQSTEGRRQVNGR